MRVGTNAEFTLKPIGETASSLHVSFDRASDPYSERHKTCESMNANRLNTLKQECEDNSFDHWARIYNIPRKIYDKFEPCIGNGQIIEGETKKVIWHCHCYNFCGETQTNNGDCVVQGLDRSLDKDADIRTTYTPMYVSIFLSISQYPLSLYFSNVMYFPLVFQLISSVEFCHTCCRTCTFVPSHKTCDWLVSVIYIFFDRYFPLTLAIHAVYTSLHRNLST